MTEYYHIVPWYTSKEWHHVYCKVFSPTSTTQDKEEALNILLVWKARCISLPSGVESTLSLLEVNIQDVKTSDDLLNEHLLRLAYSSAIMRFVNHMLDAETAKGSSLYKAARNLGIPDWVIDLRHDTAHSNNLPSIELLREASIICLDWLKVQYWDKYSEYIQDYIVGQVDIDTENEYKIATLMNFCISLSICAHPNCKIKNLSGIPDPNMRESIINDAKELFGNSIDLSNLKTVSITSLVNAMSSNARKILKMKNVTILVNKALLGEDSLFLSQELHNFLSDGSKKKQLSKAYVLSFETLLTFLQTHNLLLDFILELIKMSHNSNDVFKQRLASLWVSEILKSLRKCIDFSERMDRNNSDEAGWKNRKDLKSLFRHWFPNEKSDAILFDLHKGIPIELTNIDYIQPIISEYNPNLSYFIKDLLKLINPRLPKQTMDKICYLAKIISSSTKPAAVSAKIYSVDDLKPFGNINDDDSDCMEVIDSNNSESDKVEMIEINPTEGGVWRKASANVDWSTCPIGQLPWQQTHETTSSK